MKNAFTLIEVPFSSLRLQSDPHVQFRRTALNKELFEAVSKLDGSVDPLSVYQDQDGMYVILDGTRRYACLEKLVERGKLTAGSPIKVLSQFKPEDKEGILNSQINRNCPKRYDIASLAYLIKQMDEEREANDKKPLTLRSLANTFSVSSCYIHNIRKLSLHPNLDDMLDKLAKKEVTAQAIWQALKSGQEPLAKTPKKKRELKTEEVKYCVRDSYEIFTHGIEYGGLPSKMQDFLAVFVDYLEGKKTLEQAEQAAEDASTS